MTSPLNREAKELCGVPAFIIKELEKLNYPKAEIIQFLRNVLSVKAKTIARTRKRKIARKKINMTCPRRVKNLRV